MTPTTAAGALVNAVGGVWGMPAARPRISSSSPVTAMVALLVTVGETGPLNLLKT